MMKEADCDSNGSRGGEVWAVSWVQTWLGDQWGSSSVSGLADQWESRLGSGLMWCGGSGGQVSTLLLRQRRSGRRRLSGSWLRRRGPEEGKSGQCQCPDWGGWSVSRWWARGWCYGETWLGDQWGSRSVSGLADQWESRLGSGLMWCRGSGGQVSILQYFDDKVGN